MAKGIRRECPREIYLKKATPGGHSKQANLRGILKQIMLALDFQRATSADVRSIVAQMFTQNTTMLPFESDAERDRMTTLIDRYLEFEQRFPNHKVLAKAGEEHITLGSHSTTARFHILIDRGNALEAIVYRYKSPEYTYRARSDSSKPNMSPELLRLQKAGEAAAIRLGIDIKKKPVFGVIMYMKGRGDTAVALAPQFEAMPGDNIISHHFSPTDELAVLNHMMALQPDVTKCCDPSECDDCRYHDLCYLVFEKRHKIVAAETESKAPVATKLTDAQYALVSMLNGVVRCNAGAGTGKTMAVAWCAINYFENGAAENEILLVTFTDKARGEMRARIRALLNSPAGAGIGMNVENVCIETFNSWGQHLLDMHYLLIGFTAPPSLIDDVQKKDIIIEILDKHRNLPLDYRNPMMSTRSAEGAVTKMVKMVDKLKAAHAETPADVARELGSRWTDYAAEILSIYQEYNAQLLSKNLLDYEDQLRYLLTLANFGVFEKLPYRHIIVDEFQDSNPNQIDIIVELKRRNPKVQSLVVVGDELQSIYGFRNASPDNLVSFNKYFPDMLEVNMSENFRSGNPIVEASNKIFRHTARVGQQLKAHRMTSGTTPAIIEVDSPEREMDLYIRQVKKLIADGTAPSDIAILCRTRSELIKLQCAMDKAGIPTLLKVPEIILEAPYVKATIALASFLKDPNDLRDLALFAKSMGQDPFDMQALQVSRKAILDTFAACTNEAEKISTFFQYLQDASEDYVADAFLQKMRLRSFLTLQQYLDYCTKYRDYDIRDSQSTAKENTECVSLITVHSAKGLEWHTVLLSIKSFGSDDEASRLFYVGVTRARDRLLVTYTQKQALLVSMLR